MALEAAIYSQDPFGYPPLFKDHYYGYNGFHQQQEDDQGAINRSPPLVILDDKIMFNDSTTTTSPPAPTQQPIHGITSSYCWEDCFYYNINNHHHYFSSPELCTTACGGAFFNPPPQEEDVVAPPTFVAPARRKRRRTKSTKNKEEVESQRMTHIAVERNRRKQMNEYLALLRSLMPPSYVQRGDQASIIGGAINFVKELEQLLQAMQAQKAANHHQQQHDDDEGHEKLANNGLSSLFSDFFAFPQYSARKVIHSPADSLGGVAREAAVGEIEVTMVDCHANVKILVRKQHRQLVKLVAGLQGLGFTILHLNVTATSTGSDQTVLYSLSFKVEEGCRLITADEIAAAVNQMLRRIEEGSYYQEC